MTLVSLVQDLVAKVKVSFQEVRPNVRLGASFELSQKGGASRWTKVHQS